MWGDSNRAAGQTVKPISAKKQRFVEEYFLDWNATRAARRAGYNEKTAGSVGARLLKDAQVAHLIAEKRTELTERTHKAVEDMVLTPAKALLANARIATFDIRKLFDEDGRRIPIHKLDDDTAAAIVGYEDTLVGTKLKIADKGAALEKAFKHLGLYQLDNEQSAAKAVVMFAEMRALVAANPLSRQQPVLNPPEQHIHQ